MPGQYPNYTANTKNTRRDIPGRDDINNASDYNDHDREILTHQATLSSHEARMNTLAENQNSFGPGAISKVTLVTDTYTILTADATIICNKETPFTVTLPATVVGKIFLIKNIGEGLVTIDGQGYDTIDDEPSQIMRTYEAITVQCYAANSWGII